MHQTNSSR